jgi:hypothetical protein
MEQAEEERGMAREQAREEERGSRRGRRRGGRRRGSRRGMKKEREKAKDGKERELRKKVKRRVRRSEEDKEGHDAGAAMILGGVPTYPGAWTANLQLPCGSGLTREELLPVLPDCFRREWLVRSGN